MATFQLWAPKARVVEVEVCGSRLPLIRTGDGKWQTSEVGPDTGADYGFVLDGGERLPDPRSRWQPNGVHGPSRLIAEDSFKWSDRAWRGIPLSGSVIYELHLGTFTPAGTFDAAIAKLDHLVHLGVDLVELLPVNAFAGEHGWGYDGVDIYAVHEAYGGPLGLHRFVDACHAHGLGVIMDVVYNHFGPAGNYLSHFAPYLSDCRVTHWGSDTVNFDSPGSDEVRRFVIENALMWLRDYHCDGLRLDAVHAIVDKSAVHILEELAVEVEALAAYLGRVLFLIAESDLNDPRLVADRRAGGLGIDGQWNDDFHHALHAVLTGEHDGYYMDFGTLGHLATAFTSGFVYTGQYSPYRDRRHGRATSNMPASSLLAYLQNHDQVGNRAKGERSAALLSEGLLKVGAALVLAGPFTPMLFMGEEWAASSPWQYFTDFDDPGLGAAVREGRRREFAAFSWNVEDIPDPQDPSTFERSKLDWAEIDREPHRTMLEWYRSLIAVRRAVPAISDPRLSELSACYDEGSRWLVLSRCCALIVCNLSAHTQDIPIPRGEVTVLLASSQDLRVDDGRVLLGAEAVVILRRSCPHLSSF